MLRANDLSTLHLSSLVYGELRSLRGFRRGKSGTRGRGCMFMRRGRLGSALWIWRRRWSLRIRKPGTRIWRRGGLYFRWAIVSACWAGESRCAAEGGGEIAVGPFVYALRCLEAGRNHKTYSTQSVSRTFCFQAVSHFHMQIIALRSAPVTSSEASVDRWTLTVFCFAARPTV